MCMFSPKVPSPKPPAQFQAIQNPVDQVSKNSSSMLRRQRGLYASLFTSPQGIAGRPMVTGTSGGMTGG